MIKNIIFDMGNVLLNYNPDVCLNMFLDCDEDREIIKRELLKGRSGQKVIWEFLQMQRGSTV